MRTHLAAIVFTVSGTANLVAQPVEPQVPAPTFPTEIEQVVVDVVVTDKKGQPVSGLTLDDLIVTARSADGVVMGVRHRTHSVEGVQFHPESILTPEGDRLLRNFLDFDAVGGGA